MNIPCFLIPAIVGILCALLGYLLGKYLSKSSVDKNYYKADLDACKLRNNQLKSDIDALRGQQSTSQKFSDPLVGFNSDAAKSVFGKKIKENDLKIIEGIGPKIEELFKKNGITTWKILSKTSVDRCNEILDIAGERYSLHDPGTWPRQSKLAHEGNWLELKKWQNLLDGGREK